MNSYLYYVLEFDNYDGDSFNLTLDLGFDLCIHRQCRLYGADTPELRGGTDEQKKAGYLARDKVREWCNDALMDDNLFFDSENYAGKFGRPLGDMVRMSETGVKSLRQYLFDNHLAVPYEGQAKSEVAEQHAANLAVLKERGLV